MSRIEKALEKAMRQRDGETSFPAESDPVEKAEERQDPQKLSPSRKNDPYEVYRQVPRPRIQNPFMVTVNEPQSPASEQYRKLKSLVVQLARGERPLNSLMVTSTIGGEGKTVTAINLAVTLAQEFDHTVLLVEGDVRRPTIMKYLGLESKKGLTDCLLDGLDIGEALVKTGIGNLSILPAGRSVSNPVELFSSARMYEILTELKNRYPDRYVIFDTTPILPFAESHYLAQRVDGIVFIVRQNLSPTDKVKDALEILKGSNLLGVVFNDVDASTLGNGYYGYYGYYGFKKQGRADP